MRPAIDCDVIGQLRTFANARHAAEEDVFRPIAESKAMSVTVRSLL